MLRVGEIFKRRGNNHGVAPVSRKSKVYKSVPWLAGAALAVAVPTVINAQQTPTNNAPNVKAESTVNTDVSSSNATSKSEVNSNSQASDDSASDNSKSHVSTHVTVNGHHIDVPANGSVHTSVPDGNGNNSNVNISVNSSQGSSTNQSSSSSSVSVFSQSSNFSVNQETSE